MVFNSLEFFIFFTAVLALYGFVSRRELGRDLFLLSASYIFYSAWYWEYSLLILASTVVDYFVGQKMASTDNARHKKRLLFVSLGFNLGMLGVFKYFNFFADLTVSTVSVFGFEMSPIQHQLLLPVGISFYTFQTLSYTIDIYRGNLKPERNFIKFAVFVSFFPQLVAGPIVRAVDFLPQLRKKLEFTTEQTNQGLILIFSGLIKKLLIADSLAMLAVDDIFENPLAYSSWDTLMALYAYALQIYCDFSGYSDIAIGIALILGFKLPVNFNRPYISKDPSEFWTRWHISLSSWLRDYLYIPLGGGRGGELFTYRNLFLTMVIGGLWHGAAMNFVLWGVFHGAILMAFRPFRKFTASAQGLQRVGLILLTFHLVLFGWLLFRVSNMDLFSQYIQSVSRLDFSTTILSPYFYCVLCIAYVWHFVPTDSLRNPFQKLFLALPVWFQAGCYSLLLILFSGLTFNTPEFLYFQF